MSLLPFCPAPYQFESGRGYLVRVAEALSYGSSEALTALVGLGPGGINNPGYQGKFAEFLRLPIGDLEHLLHRRVAQGSRSAACNFHGHVIASGLVNLGTPRVCPSCIRDGKYCRAEWDLTLFAACPIHKCALIDACPRCHRRLTWSRASVSFCNCGYDLSEAASDTVSRNAVAIAWLLHRACHRSRDMHSDLIEAAPAIELLVLDLPRLLRLIDVLGRTFPAESDGSRPKHGRSKGRAAAERIVDVAANVLLEWPLGFYERLRQAALSRVAATGRGESAAELLGHYNAQWRRQLHEPEFGFIHAAFRDFVLEMWTKSDLASRVDTNARWSCVQDRRTDYPSGQAEARHDRLRRLAMRAYRSAPKTTKGRRKMKLPKRRPSGATG